MARIPTFEEYARKGKHGDGIKRCDELLKKNPNNVEILTTKLRLLCASGLNAEPTLEQLVAVQPPIQDLREIIIIDDAVTGAQDQVYPPPATLHPLVSTIWDNAFKSAASANRKWELFSYRFPRAVHTNRIGDAQQALIQLKAFQPKDRAVYMAHAAYTQLLSSAKDDLQSRLALLLARKAVSERFDDDKSLDCRVPGQIFAIQKAEKDLATIADRPGLRESKQVYEASKANQPPVSTVSSVPSPVPDPSAVPTRQWLDSEVAALKTTCATLLTEDAAPTVVVAFTANAIRLSHTAATALGHHSHRGTAEACFLAVTGLVRLFVQTDDSGHLMLATHLLETLLRRNSHIHEARLILVYLYMRLGLGSLAMQMYDSLRVKEVQQDTVGHTLFTRLSTVHPFPVEFSRRESFDPLGQTEKALAMYRRHEEKLADCEAKALDHAQTGMIFDLHELRSSLRQSLMKRIFTLEHRRYARASSQAVAKSVKERGEIGPRKVANWMQTKDNRDFNAAFDYGLNVEKALFQRGGAIASTHYTLALLAADTAWSLATGRVAPLITDTEDLVSEMTKAFDMLSASSQNTAGLTSAEILSLDLSRRSVELIHQSKTAQTVDPRALEAIITAIDRLPIDPLSASSASSFSLCEHLPDHYLYIDQLRIVLAVSRHLQDTHSKNSSSAPPPPPISELLPRLQTLATRRLEQLQKHMREQAAQSTTANVRARLRATLDRDEALRAAVESYGGADDGAFEDAVQRIAVSARLGWEGGAKIARG